MCNMRGRIAPVAAVLTWLAVGVLPAAAEPAVTGIRIGEHVDLTRFVVDTTESVDYRIFVLPDPYRVVVDLPELRWRLAPARGMRGGGLIQRFRFGLYRPGTSRVVLDVAAPVEVYRSFVLAPQGNSGYRFVIDLKETSRSSFLAAVRAARPLAGQPTPVPRPQARAKTENDKIVVAIDPGHGGIDPGTISIHGRFEKDIVLAVGLALRAKLVASGRYKVAMTRSRDRFLQLRDRVKVARRAGADLFLSIHADAIAQGTVRGATVYTLSEQGSDAEADALAARENKSDVIAGVDLERHTDDVASILIDLAQRDTMNRSALFVQQLLPALGERVRLRTKPHRSAGFRILKAPDVPAALIEMGYHSNPSDERLLTSKDGQSLMAAAMAEAIDRYFKTIRSSRR